MNYLKTKLNDYGPVFFKKIGCLANPIILKFKNENKQLLVFFFHGLFESEKQRALNLVYPQNNMTVKQFIDFIDYFQRCNYKFILPEEIGEGLSNDQPYAMITFDDGYFNNILAIEILNKYKIPAVFFISTKNVVENKSYWWDIIYKYRAEQGNSPEKIGKEIRSLKTLKYDCIDQYILENFGKEAFTPWSDICRPFNQNEIKELAKNPYVSFGNHTHNHAILINYNKQEIKKELSVSNQILFELTGTLPIAMAFPNGNYNEIALKATEEQGFRYAFTTKRDTNRFPIERKELTCLNRYMTDTRDINTFGGFCRMGYEPADLYEDLKIRTMRMFKLK